VAPTAAEAADASVAAPITVTVPAQSPVQTPAGAQ
jgi:hypothetical protein